MRLARAERTKCEGQNESRYLQGSVAVNGTATRTCLRSRSWLDNPDNPDMTALYIERYLNYGLSLEELQSNRPIVGIAQTGNDVSAFTGSVR